jgi:hypothetical protein
VSVRLHAIGKLLHRDEAPLKGRAICRKPECFRTSRSTSRASKDIIALLKGRSGDEAEQKIKAAEEALKRADVALAQKLGFKLCDCTFPPQIMLWHEKEKVTKCPRTECGHTIQDFNRPLPRSSGGWMSA